MTSVPEYTVKTDRKQFLLLHPVPTLAQSKPCYNLATSLLTIYGQLTSMYRKKTYNLILRLRELKVVFFKKEKPALF